MKKSKNVNTSLVVFVSLALLLVLGILIGVSLTAFILFLQSKKEILAIISYLCLVVFILVLIVDIFLFIYYRHDIFINKKIKEIKTKEALENEIE